LNNRYYLSAYSSVSFLIEGFIKNLIVPILRAYYTANSFAIGALENEKNHTPYKARYFTNHSAALLAQELLVTDH